MFPGQQPDLVLGVDIGSGLHQQFDRLAEAMPGHLVQRRVAVLLTGSDSRLVSHCLFLYLTQKHNHPPRDNSPVYTFLSL